MALAVGVFEGVPTPLPSTGLDVRDINNIAA